MIVHIGSIKEEELRPTLELDPKKACYPNHLGIIGTARLITMCKPRLSVVSEFGEEMRQFRCALVKGLQEKVIDRMFPKPGKTGKQHLPKVVPGDLAFIYDIGADKFYCCMDKDWCNIHDIAFGVNPKSKDLKQSIYYFSAKSRSNFKRNPNSGTEMFDTSRQTHTGMYFRKDAD